MIVLTGTLFLLAALSVHVAHDSIRGSSRIRLRHLADDRPATAPALDLHIEHPEYFRIVVGAIEYSLIALGAMLLCLRFVPSAHPALTVISLIAASAAFAVVASFAGSLARHWDSSLLHLSAPVLATAIRPVAALIRPRSVAVSTTGVQTADELEAERDAMDELIEEGLREGISDPEDMKLVSGVVYLRDTLVSDVMVKRDDIFALSMGLPLLELTGSIARSGYSRVPIYNDDLDGIIGIYHVLDVLKYGPDDLPPLRPVLRVPGTERCSELLMRMLRTRAHICVVIDSTGRTAGIVTLEDLLEEIVGEIRDEYDEPAPGSASIGGG